MKTCSFCNSTVPDTEKVCPACGKKLKNTKLTYSKNKSSKSTLSKLFPFIIIGIIILIFAFVCCFMFSSKSPLDSSSSTDFVPSQEKPSDILSESVVYKTTQGELKYISPNNDTGFVFNGVSSDIFTYYISKTNQNFLYLDDNFDLYLKDIQTQNTSTDKGILIAQDVKPGSFYITSNDKYIVYSKNDNSLYFTDLNNHTVISKKQSTFAYMGDTHVYYYIDEDYSPLLGGTFSLCVFDMTAPEKGSTKISSNCFGEIFVSDDEQQVIYQTLNPESGDIQLVDVNMFTSKDKNKLLATCNVLNNANPNTGEIFYSNIVADTKINAAELIQDDIKDQDVNIENPDYDEFAANFDGSSAELYDAYLQALREYYDKLNRDDIRENIDTKATFDLYDVYFLDKNNKQNKLAENAYNVLTTDFESQSLIYAYVDVSKFDTILLSELSTTYECSIEKALLANMKVVVALSTPKTKAADITTTALNLDLVSHTSVIHNNHGYLLLRENQHDVLASLHSFDLSTPNTLVKIADDVEILTLDNKTGSLFGVKNMNFTDNTAVHYVINQNKATEITNSQITTPVTHFDNGLTYYTVYDSNGFTIKSLNTFVDNTATVIAENAGSYKYISKDKIFFLKNIDPVTMAGDLYFYNGTTQVLIENNVTSIL